jgi:hypothetical protein
MAALHCRQWTIRPRGVPQFGHRPKDGANSFSHCSHLIVAMPHSSLIVWPTTDKVSSHAVKNTLAGSNEQYRRKDFRFLPCNRRCLVRWS